MSPGRGQTAPARLPLTQTQNEHVVAIEASRGNALRKRSAVGEASLRRPSHSCQERLDGRDIGTTECLQAGVGLTVNVASGKWSTAGNRHRDTWQFALTTSQPKRHVCGCGRSLRHAAAWSENWQRTSGRLLSTTADNTQGVAQQLPMRLLTARASWRGSSGSLTPPIRSGWH